ncbi:Golgin candidate [Arachis hypogaea]|nr:Golgin candidate [Arachis hypogaea]
MDLRSSYKEVVGLVFGNERCSDVDRYVERLLDSISNGKLVDDRRNAIIELQAVVSENQASHLAFGAMDFPIMLSVLKEQHEDFEMNSSGSATPLCSPMSSMPSTPRRCEHAPTPLDNTTDDDSHFPTENRGKYLSEEEMKLKTRRKTTALGMHLGKINIASWASNDDEEEKKSATKDANVEQHEKIEFEMHLTELALLYCQRIGNVGLLKVGKGCKFLQALHLVDCSGIGDEAMYIIAKGCRNLKKLHILDVMR